MRCSIRRFTAAFLAPLVLSACLVLVAAPALAAPETPEVRQGHGALSLSLYLQPGSRYVAPAVEYGLTDRLAVRALWSEGSYLDPGSPVQTDHRTNLTVKYEVSPDLALEAFTEHGWDGLTSGTLNGFGLFAGQRFGSLYGSLRAQAIAKPVLDTYYWFDQVTAAGSYALTPSLSLIGTVAATLDVGTTWGGSYGLEWQPARNAAVYLTRFTAGDSTELGLEYRF